MCLNISHLILVSCCNVAACCPSPCPDLAAPDSSIAGEFLDHDTHRGLGGGEGEVEVLFRAPQQSNWYWRVKLDAASRDTGASLSFSFSLWVTLAISSKIMCFCFLPNFANFCPPFHRSFSQLPVEAEWAVGLAAWPPGLQLTSPSEPQQNKHGIRSTDRSHGPQSSGTWRQLASRSHFYWS